MAKSARVAVAEADVDDEAKLSAEGEVIGRDAGLSADKADKIVDAASANSGLCTEEKAFESDLVGSEPLDMSVIDGDVVAGNPDDESVLAEKAGVDD